MSSNPTSKAGRQSPEPESQSGGQVGAPADSNIGAAPSETHAKDSSEETKLEGLESNPKPALSNAVAEDKGSGHSV